MSFQVNSQNYKTLIFSDSKDTPLEDVKVYINKTNFIAVSSFNGKCQIADTIKTIRCIYLGFKDTTIHRDLCTTNC